MKVTKKVTYPFQNFTHYIRKDKPNEVGLNRQL